MKTDATLQCQWCLKLFPSRPHGPVAKFCCGSCRQASHRDRKRTPIHPPHRWEQDGDGFALMFGDECMAIISPIEVGKWTISAIYHGLGIERPVGKFSERSARVVAEEAVFGAFRDQAMRLAAIDLVEYLASGWGVPPYLARNVIAVASGRITTRGVRADSRLTA